MTKKVRAIGLMTGLLLLSPASWASDYLFLSKRYLALTSSVLKEADVVAAKTLEKGSAAEMKYLTTSEGLRRQIGEVTRARLFKKLKPEMVAEIKNQEFANQLNTLKFALTFMAEKTGKSASVLFPTYDTWIKTEAIVVQAGLAQRLQAFETRFGPDSEQVNFIEFFSGEAFFRGDESAPSAWEPIIRLSAVQATTAGPGLVSTFETGMNYYFLKGAPTPLNWIGMSNHVGVAATLQYLNDPSLFHFEGRPALGVMLHLDRKQIGASWDPDTHNIRMTLGYAFQFVPFLL